MTPKTILLGNVLRVQVPRPPNYILLGEPSADADGPKISIAELSDDALKELGVAMTEQLLARAAEIRANSKR